MARFRRDFAVDSNGHFFRVQVKCTQHRRGDSYRCHIDSNSVPYRRDQIDFIAAYVIPADAWYILPIADLLGRPDIHLAPHRPKSKYARYHEA